MPSLSWSQWLVIGVISVLVLAQPSLASSLPQPSVDSISPELTLVELPQTLVVTNSETEPASRPFITAQAAIIVDSESGAILYAHNHQQPLAPASVTKLLTALVARDIFYLDQVLTVDQNLTVPGNSIKFRPGEKVSVRNLIKALLIQSGNDAAVILALNHPDGYEGFMAAMNEHARLLGLTNSHFINPSGLDAPDHYSSALDISILLSQALQDPFLRSALSQVAADIEDTSGLQARRLYNTNQLLWAGRALAGKTGTTEAAGQVLTTLVSINDQPVIITVLGSQDRYQDTLQLTSWLQSQYMWVELATTPLVHY